MGWGFLQVYISKEFRAKTVLEKRDEILQSDMAEETERKTPIWRERERERERELGLRREWGNENKKWKNICLQGQRENAGKESGGGVDTSN